MKPAPFEYVVAQSAREAVEALGRFGDEAKVLAGGQSLIPMMALRLARPSALVDINRCRDLEGLAESGGTLTAGALARQRDLERWSVSRSPLFAELLASVAHAPIRNRGTVVGSIVHADPASELPALLLCLDGAVTVRSRAGERAIPADKLYLAPLTTSLAADELATAARFSWDASPRPPAASRRPAPPPPRCPRTGTFTRRRPTERRWPRCLPSGCSAPPSTAAGDRREARREREDQRHGLPA